jgi:hypothetical protein
MNWLRQSTHPLGYGVCVLINMKYNQKCEGRLPQGEIIYSLDLLVA